MKKFLLLSVVLFATIFTHAQTYEVISRSNDTIRLYPNKVGEAIKSILPKSKSEVAYRLICKTQEGKNSLLFVELPTQVDKFMVSYETDLIHEGEWQTTIYSIRDILESVQKQNAILYKGNILGMNVEIHLRPTIFADVIVVDGIETPSPIKISELAIKIAKEVSDAEKEATKQLQNAIEVGLTEEDLNKAKQSPNDYYIAYLFSENLYDNSVDKTLVNELTNKDNTFKIIKEAKYTSKQLKVLCIGYDKRLEKYRLKNI